MLRVPLSTLDISNLENPIILKNPDSDNPLPKIFTLLSFFFTFFAK